MASENGRVIRIEMSTDGGTTYNTVAGAVEDSVTFSIETIDGTVKDDAGWRTLVDDVAVKSMSLSVSGKTVNGNTDLEEWWESAGAGTTLRHMRFVRPDGRTHAAQFAMPSHEMGAPDGAESTFTASFESSGTVTSGASA